MNASLPRVIVVIAALVSVASPVEYQTLRGTVWDTTSEQPVLSAHVVGFYRRQRMRFGHIVTRADMDKLNTVVMTDVLHGMAGVQVVCRRSRLCDVAMRAGRTMFVRGVCRPTVVLAGVVLRVGGSGN